MNVPDPSCAGLTTAPGHRPSRRGRSPAAGCRPGRWRSQAARGHGGGAIAPRGGGTRADGKPAWWDLHGSTAVRTALAVGGGPIARRVQGRWAGGASRAAQGGSGGVWVWVCRSRRARRCWRRSAAPGVGSLVSASTSRQVAPVLGDAQRRVPDAVPRGRRPAGRGTARGRRHSSAASTTTDHWGGLPSVAPPLATKEERVEAPTSPTAPPDSRPPRRTTLPGMPTAMEARYAAPAVRPFCFSTGGQATPADQREPGGVGSGTVGDRLAAGQPGGVAAASTDRVPARTYCYQDSAAPTAPRGRAGRWPQHYGNCRSEHRLPRSGRRGRALAQAWCEPACAKSLADERRGGQRSSRLCALLEDQVTCRLLGGGLGFGRLSMVGSVAGSVTTAVARGRGARSDPGWRSCGGAVSRSCHAIISHIAAEGEDSLPQEGRHHTDRRLSSPDCCPSLRKRRRVALAGTCCRMFT